MRGTFRFFLVLVVLIAVSLAVWLANYLFWFGAGAPQIDYQAEIRKLQANASGALPDDLRAHGVLLELAGIFDELAKEGVNEPGGDEFQRWEDLQDPEVRAAVENWITKCRDGGVTAKLDEFIGLPGYVQPWDSAMLLDNDYTNTNGAIRAAIRVGLYDAMLGLDLDETQVAVEEIVRTSKVSKLYFSQPVVINRIMGHAILAMSIKMCRDALQKEVSESELRLLAEAFDTVELYPIGTVYGGERLLAQSTIVNALPSNRTIRLMSKGAQWARIENEFDRMQSWSTLSAYERARSPFPETPEDWRYLPADIFVPALSRLALSHDQITTDLNGIRLEIAIERYLQAVGSLPATLDDLLPDYMDEIPGDIFADGEPALRYRVLDVPDDKGRDYLLYSVGYDGVDNGGVEPGETAFEALSPGYEGTDFILNRID